MDSLLALAKLSSGHRAATSKLHNDTGWVAIARLAERVVVVVFLANVASLAVEAVLAVTMTIAVTRNSVGSMRVTVAGQALRILMEARHALIASLASKVLKTRTFSGVIANGLNRSSG